MAMLVSSDTGALNIDGTQSTFALPTGSVGIAVNPQHGIGIDLTPGQSIFLGTASDFPSTSGGAYCLIRRKKDIVVRDTGLGVNPSSDSQRFGAHLPYSDNIAYFDFGGNSAGSRVSFSYTPTTDLEYWVLSAGPSGMSIWLNGQRRAFNTTPAFRPKSTVPVHLNIGNGVGSSDNQEVYQFLIYDRGLEPDEIAEWFDNPWGMVDPFSVELSRAIFASPEPAGETHGGSAILTGSATLSAQTTTNRFINTGLDITLTTSVGGSLVEVFVTSNIQNISDTQALVGREAYVDLPVIGLNYDVTCVSLSEVEATGTAFLAYSSTVSVGVSKEVMESVVLEYGIEELVESETECRIQVPSIDFGQEVSAVGLSQESAEATVALLHDLNVSTEVSKDVKTVTAIVSVDQNVTAFHILNETTTATALTNAGPVSVSAQVQTESRAAVTIPSYLVASATVEKEAKIQPLLDHETQQGAETRTECLVEISPIILHQQVTAVSSGEGHAQGAAFLSHNVLSSYVGEDKAGGFTKGFSLGFSVHEQRIGGFKDVSVAASLSEFHSVEAETEVAKEAEAVIGASQTVSAFYVLGETTTVHASVNVGSIGVSAEAKSEYRASVAVAASVSASADIGTERNVDIDVGSYAVSASASGSADEIVQSVVLVEYDAAVSAEFAKRVESGAFLQLSASQTVGARTERTNSVAIALTTGAQAVGSAQGAGSASPVIGLEQQIQADSTKAVDAETTVPHMAGLVVGSHTAVQGVATLSHSLATSAVGQRGFNATASVGITVDVAALVGKTALVPTTTAYVTASSAAGVKSARLSISADAIASVVGEVSVEKRAAALDQAVDSVQVAFHTERFSDASTALLLSGYAQGVTVPPDLMLGKIPMIGTSDTVYSVTGQMTSVVSLLGIANQAS